MAKIFKDVVPEAPDTKTPKAAPGPILRGVVMGRDRLAMGELTMTGWASFYVEIQDGRLILQSRLDDPGPKNVAAESAKLALVSKVVTGNWD